VGETHASQECATINEVKSECFEGVFNEDAIRSPPLDFLFGLAILIEYPYSLLV
jgi:hypothetical protein